MRQLPALLLAAVVLAGCGGSIVSETFGEAGASLPVPTADTIGSAPPNDGEADGTIVLETGVIADGPGEPIAAALGSARTEPTLVNGVLMLDAGGSVWLCHSVLEGTPPRCGEPRLLVANYPEGSATFDMDSADITGAQESDGVIWLEGQQLFGVVRRP